MSSDYQMTDTDRQLAADKRLAREAATWRTRAQSAESRIAELEARLGASPTSGDASAAAKPDEGDDRGSVPAPTTVDASSKAAAADVSDDDLAYEQKRFAELTRRAIVADLDSSGVMYADEVYELMVGRGQLVIDDDGNGALVVDGKPVPITKESVARIVRAEFLRAEGSGGAGTKGSKMAASSNDFDLDRALRDVRYFNLHRAETEAAMRRR